MTDKTKIVEPDLGSISGDHTTRMDLPPDTPRRVRRSITPARLYREIQHAQEVHVLVDDATIQDLLEAILQDVLRDALDD